MTRNHAIHAVVALALSASPLFAQDTPPKPQPPEAGSTPREGHQRSGPQPKFGIFALLDANHDGAIDQTEASRAGEILRKLDHDADGRITPREMLPGGQGRDGGARIRHGGPGDQGKRSEGSRDPSPRREGATDHGSRAEGHRDRPRPEASRRDGERPASPGGEARRDGERAPGRAPQGPRDGERAEKPSRDGDREHGRRPEAHGDRRGPSEGVCHACPQPPARSESEARREGPKGPPPGRPAHAQPPQRHGFPGGPGGERYAQNVPRPDFGRDNRHTPRANPPKPGGGDRQMPAHMGRPDSGRQSDLARGPGDFHSPEGRREGRPQRPPMEERGPRPPGPGQRDVQ